MTVIVLLGLVIGMFGFIALVLYILDTHQTVKRISKHLGVDNFKK